MGQTRYFASRDQKRCCPAPCPHNWYIANVNIYTVQTATGPPAGSGETKPEQTKILVVSFPQYVTAHLEIRNANPQELYNIMTNRNDPNHSRLQNDVNIRVFMLSDYVNLYGEIGFVYE